MGLNCGIVGLPNVGKSTIFSALCRSCAEIANYPFSTIKPNVGIVSVPDERLDRIATLVDAEKTVHATVEFVDIAGLVKGASKGEGLGNRFLSHIRQVNLIAHVVRCFQDPNVTHVENRFDPIEDIEIINTELALADLESVERGLTKNASLTKSSDRTTREMAIAREKLLSRLREVLSRGIPVRSLELSDEEERLLTDLDLITQKKQIYLCNLDESSLSDSSLALERVQKMAQKERAEVVSLCGRLENEIASIEDIQERALFQKELGLQKSGLDRVIQSTYAALGLQTFFTVGDVENKAWPFPKGQKVPQTAGLIHSDFEKGFIRVQAYSCEDLFTFGSERAVKESGKLRVEGKEYVVQDSDILHFLFNR